MIGLFDISLPKKIVAEAAMKERLENLKRFFALRQYLIDFYELNQTEKGEYFRQWGFREKSQLPLFAVGLTARVIKQTSMVYKFAPQRVLISGDGAEIENNGYANLIQDHDDFNPIMKQLERYRKLLHNVILRPSYDEDSGEYKFYVETEYIPEFGSEDSLYPIGYHFPRYGKIPGSSDAQEYFIYVSKEEIWGHRGAPEDKSDRFELEGKEGGIHDYGMIPCIDYSPPPVNDYWTFGARDLVDGNRSLIIALLTTDYGHQFQSFDQSWVRNLDPAELNKDTHGRPEMKVGVDDTWNLGIDGEAGLLGFNPKLVESAKWIETRLNMVLDNYHVKADLNPTGTPMSGFALRVKNGPLLEERQSVIDDIYRSREQKLYRLLAAMNRVHGTGYFMPEDAKIRVDFVDPALPIEPDEQRAQDDWKLQHNLVTRIDWMMRENPDLSREEAEKLYKDNQSLNNEQSSQTTGIFDRFQRRQTRLAEEGEDAN